MRSLSLLFLPCLLLACSDDGGEGEASSSSSGAHAASSSGAGASSGDSGNTSSGGASSGSSGSSGSNGGSSGASSGGSSSGEGASSGGSSGEPAPTHEDGIQNGDETDIDCGGASAPPCAPTQNCVEGRDCSSSICDDTVCTTPSDDDGVKNGDETGTDCGGPTSLKKCAPEEGCAVPDDCLELVCEDQVCQHPRVGDGVKNGDETGVDCGGPIANPRCAPGETCVAPSDCVEGVCDDATNQCAQPTDNDGVQNQGERGVDCGGPNTTKRCVAGTSCGEDADCTSDACAYDGKCAPYPSCKNHMGGDTCGVGELYHANPQHESCCTTLPVPTAGNIKLDKYNITAGRMRAFVEATGGDVKGWVQTAGNKPAWWRNDWDNYLPEGLMVPWKVVDSANRNLGVYGQLGPNFVYNQDGAAGCWSGLNNGETGAPTYWIPKADRQTLNPKDQGSLYSQDKLDQKSLNCVNVLMLAAFCAWDGGRLPTIDEMEAAWKGNDNRYYPWGDAPVPAGFPSGYPNPSGLTPANGDPLVANYRKNYPQNSIEWNEQGGLPGNQRDLALYIAPPGRFPLGAGPYGHMDLAGNVFNVTSTFTGSATDTLAMISRWTRSGSWETAHDIPYGVHRSPVLRKYWAQGGRCVKN